MTNNDTIDGLYLRFLRSEERDRPELVDELLAEVSRLAFGSSGERYVYALEGNLSAIAPADEPSEEAVRLVVDHEGRKISMIATLDQGYDATHALHALIADPAAREYRYHARAHLVLIPTRQGGQVLLEGDDAFDRLLTLFFTTPERIWIIGRNERSVEQANGYLRDPGSLKQAIVDNLKWQLASACHDGGKTLLSNRRSALFAHIRLFAGLVHFSKDDKEWKHWADSVLPAYKDFVKKFPGEAALKKKLEPLLVEPVEDDDHPKGQYKTVNTPSLLAR